MPWCTVPAAQRKLVTIRPGVTEADPLKVRAIQATVSAGGVIILRINTSFEPPWYISPSAYRTVTIVDDAPQ